MAKQTAMIYHSIVKKEFGIFQRILIFLERRQYVLFFQFRQAHNNCRADRTSINPRKILLELFNQIKLILVIDQSLK